MCQKVGLLSEGPVYMDTTLVQAAASMDSLKERAEGIKPPLTIREYVHRSYIENAPSPPRYRKIRPNGHRCKANNELVSRTDPEATVVSRQGFDLHFAYKAHIAAAGMKGQVITAALATMGVKADEHLLDEMLRYHSKVTGLPVKEAVADAIYGTIANYIFLQEAGMTVFIPPR